MNPKAMASVIPIPAARPPSDRIEFVEAYASIDYIAGTVTFTPEGRGYYEGWFRRYGFSLDGCDDDAERFVKTVMFINRESSVLHEDRLRELMMSGDLTIPEIEMWRKYLAGDFNGFSGDLARLADAEIRAVPSNVVQLFRAKN